MNSWRGREGLGVIGLGDVVPGPFVGGGGRGDEPWEWGGTPCARLTGLFLKIDENFEFLLYFADIFPDLDRRGRVLIMVACLALSLGSSGWR
jgi:hypothetical protein